MLNTFKQKISGSLVKETFVYTITDVISKALAFVLLPIVSFYMSPDELGLATNFSVLTNLLSLVAGLAVVNSLPFFFYEQGREDKIMLVSNLLIICGTLCLLFLFIVIFFNKICFHYLLLDLHIQIFAVIYVFAMLISQCSLILMRLENNTKQFAYIQIFQIIFHAIAVLFFVITLNGGGEGKIYAETMVYTFMGFFHFFIIYKKGYFEFKINKIWIKKLLKFGIPLIPHSISFWLKSGMDKIFITTFCGLQFNGLYSMAISIGSIYTMFVLSFLNAYVPYLQKKLSFFDDGKKHWSEKLKLVKQTYLILLLFGIIGGLALAGSWFVFHYMIDSKYLPSLNYMPLIILSSFIHTIYNFTIQYIYKMKKTFVMGIITFTGSIVQLLLSYWLIQLFGVMGAVYSLLIGNILITIGISVYSNMVYKMPWLLNK